MPSQTKYPSTGQSLSTGISWTNPGNIGADDGSETYRSSSGLSAQLTGTNYGFTIPTAATILGIVLEIKRRHTVDVNTVDNTVKLKKSSGAVGDNKSIATEWPQTVNIATYGSSSDLWGTTWTPADINDSGFGAYLINNVPSPAGDSYVDFFRITVYHDQPSESSSISLSPSFSSSSSTSPSPSSSISNSPSSSYSSSLSPSSSISKSNSPSPSIGYQAYTKGDYSTLPTDTTDLETPYTNQEELNVAHIDGQYVNQSATNQYMIHQYKDFVPAESNVCSLEWRGKSTKSTSINPVYLQIYNQVSTEWETVDTENTVGEDVTFTLSAYINDVTNYKDASGLVSCRVYQQAS